MPTIRAHNHNQQERRPMINHTTSIEHKRKGRKPSSYQRGNQHHMEHPLGTRSSRRTTSAPPPSYPITSPHMTIQPTKIQTNELSSNTITSDDGTNWIIHSISCRFNNHQKCCCNSKAWNSSSLSVLS